MTDPRAALEDVIRGALAGRDRARRNLRPDARRGADEVFVAAVLKQHDQAVKAIRDQARNDRDADQRIMADDIDRIAAERDNANRLLDALRDELTEARERLRLAREALTGDGYFTPDQVGDDIAPRIIERLAAAQQAPVKPAPRPRRPRTPSTITKKTP